MSSETIFVPDTSVLLADPARRGAQWQLFIQAFADVGVGVRIPEVVLDEAVTLFAEQLRRASEEVRSKMKTLNRFVSASLTPDENAIEAAISGYRERLLGDLSVTKMWILPYPDVAHRDLTKRQLERRKPYSGKERHSSGYRDDLIWHSLLGLLIARPDALVVFVCGNEKDFGGPDGLDPKFADDLRAAGLEPTRLRLVASMAAFNSEFVEPKLKTQEQLRLKLETRQTDVLDLTDWIARNLPEHFTRHQLWDLIATASTIEITPQPLDREFVHFDVENVWDLPDEVVVECSGSAGCKFEILEETGSADIPSTVGASLQFAFTLILDKTGNHVVHSSLDALVLEEPPERID